MDMTFGSLIREKRLEKGLSLRKLASLLGIAPAYMSDLENDHRNPPEMKMIDEIAAVLDFSRSEHDLLYDLAAGNRKYPVPPDISEYIMGEENLRTLIRMARDRGIGDSEWKMLLDRFER